QRLGAERYPEIRGRDEGELSGAAGDEQGGRYLWRSALSARNLLHRPRREDRGARRRTQGQRRDRREHQEDTVMKIAILGMALAIAAQAQEVQKKQYVSQLTSPHVSVAGAKTVSVELKFAIQPE